MISINEDIKNIIYKMASEIVYENRGNCFEQAFYNFLSSVRNYIGKTKYEDKVYGTLKSKILDIFNKIKNSKPIFGILTENFENQLNEIIYTTKLNKVKSVSDGEIDNEEFMKHYIELDKILSFEIPADIDDEYGLWCFLKIGRIISGIYESSENNIINEDLTVNDVKSTLRFSFKNSGGESAELLYNYKNISKNKNFIYLIVKKHGREPVSFAFETKSESIDGLHTLRDSLCSEINGEVYLLFSGIFILNLSDIKNEDGYKYASANKLGKINFSPLNTESVADLLSRISVYDSAVSECLCNYEIAERLRKYEIERRNLLVVTVKSKEQLEINLKNNFYYMPVSQFLHPICDCEYLAVYQSATIFGEASGILYFGEIEDVRMVRRNEILEIPKDSDEKYLRFSVKWKTRDHKIKADCAVRAFAETSYEIFKNAENVSELYFRGYEEYKTFIFLKDIFKNVKIFGNENGIYEIKADNFRLELNGFGIVLYDDNKYIFGLSRYKFLKNLKAFLKKIKELKEEKNSEDS